MAPPDAVAAEKPAALLKLPLPATARLSVSTLSAIEARLPNSTSMAPPSVRRRPRLPFPPCASLRVSREWLTTRLEDCVTRMPAPCAGPPPTAPTDRLSQMVLPATVAVPARTDMPPPAPLIVGLPPKAKLPATVLPTTLRRAPSTDRPPPEPRVALGRPSALLPTTQLSTTLTVAPLPTP